MIFLPNANQTSVDFYIAQFVQDPFRQEPRNVGVIVKKDDAIAARFIGESDSEGSWDLKRLRAFRNQSAYKMWVDRWRKLMHTDLELLPKASSQSYKIVLGGGVAETGTDSASDICRYLYELLVTTGGLSAALGETEDATQQLKRDLHDAFRVSKITAGSPDVTNPVLINQAVLGKSNSYDVAFLQRNQEMQRLIEPIDFTRSKKIVPRDRAAYLRVMFQDVQATSGLRTHAFAVTRVKMKKRNHKDVKLGLGILENSCKVVDWSIKQSREDFLADCIRFAREVA